MNILLIDDDEIVLETVSLLLAAEGHTVIPATSGRDAIARLEGGESVDLVLTDLHMPDMNGWEIIRAVRARWPSVRVGLNSGSLGEFPPGHDPLDVVLRKPVTLLQLSTAIGRLADQ